MKTDEPSLSRKSQRRDGSLQNFKRKVRSLDGSYKWIDPYRDWRKVYISEIRRGKPT